MVAVSPSKQGKYHGETKLNTAIYWEEKAHSGKVSEAAEDEKSMPPSGAEPKTKTAAMITESIFIYIFFI